MLDELRENWNFPQMETLVLLLFTKEKELKC